MKKNKNIINDGCDLALEKSLKKLGFKCKYFNDGSGRWFRKDFNHLDIKMSIYIQFEPDMLHLEVKNGDYTNGKLKMNKFYDPIKVYKLSGENIQMLIKRYK